MTRATVRRLGAAGLAALCLVVVVGQATADNTQTLTVESVSASENAGTLDFVVKLSAGPDTANFDYTTADGTAKQPSDYTEKTGTDVSVAGGGTVTIQVPIADDDLYEGNQSLTLNITGIELASNTTVSATGNILDNDAAPVVNVQRAATGERGRAGRRDSVHDGQVGGDCHGQLCQAESDGRRQRLRACTR